MPVRARSDTVLRVTIFQTLALFVGVPLLIYVLLALFSMVPGRSRKRPKYQPGEPWDYPAQWWAGDTPVAVTGVRDTPGERTGGARGNW